MSRHQLPTSPMFWLCSYMQGRLAEIEGEFECTKVALKQKEKDVEEYRKVRRRLTLNRDFIMSMFIVHLIVQFIIYDMFLYIWFGNI